MRLAFILIEFLRFFEPHRNCRYSIHPNLICVCSSIAHIFYRINSKVTLLSRKGGGKRMCDFYSFIKIGELLILLCSFKEFFYTIDDHSCLKSFIFINLLQIVCLINLHILVCQHAKCDCRLQTVFLFNCVFTRIFTY